MRRRLTTIVSILATILIIGMMLTACGDGDDKDAPQDTKPEASETSTEDTDEDAGDIAALLDEVAEGVEESASIDYSDMEGSWKFDGGLFYLTFDNAGNWVFKTFAGYDVYNGRVAVGYDGYMNVVN